MHNALNIDEKKGKITNGDEYRLRVEPEKLMDVVKATGKKILAKGQVAVRLCKAAANEGSQTDINRAMTIEADAFGFCFATADQREGMKAFLEKRKAEFTGK